MEAEGVTFAAGVPTIWQMLLCHVQPQQLRFSSLKRTVIGGAACPPAMIAAFEDDFGVQVAARLGHDRNQPPGRGVPFQGPANGLAEEEQRKISAKQGRAIYGVEMKSSAAMAAPSPGMAKPMAICWCAGRGFCSSTTRARAR